MTTKEIRSFRIELRARKPDPEDPEDEDEDEDRSLQGLAIVYDSPSEDLGGFREIIAPGALKRSLAAVADGSLNVYALWSHDWSQPLGSTSGGKLKITDDDRGLAFDLDTTRMTPLMLDAAKDGELRMSFGFVVVSQEWEETEGQEITRTITDLDLLEVSPVCLPAYPDTSAALRSLGDWKESRVLEAEDKYSSRARLLKRFLEHRLKS